jgi:hypothetical protein
MQRIASVLLSIVLGSVVVAPMSTFAASGDAYKTRKAECQARAKRMNFGVHLIKKNRWVKDCIAGRHAA